MSLTFGGANTAIATLNAVEKVKISDYSGVAVDAANWSGVTGIEFANSTSATTVNNVTAIPTVTLTKTLNNVTVTMAAAAVAGASDAATVNLNGLTDNTKTFTMNGIETLTLNATGADSKVRIADTGLKTLVVTGDKKLDISAAAAPTSVTSVDASAKTAGGFLVDLTGSTLTSVKGGAGDDTILLSSTAVGATVIDGGAGTDTLGLNIANVAGALVTTSKISNVETLKIQDANLLAGAETIALGNVTGLKNLTYGALLTVDQGTAMIETVTGLTDGSVVRFDAGTVNTSGTASSGIVLTMTDAATGTNDTLNIVLAKGAAAAAAEALTGFTSANVENIVFDVKSLTGNTTTIDGVADAQLSKLTFKSSALDATGAATDAADLTVAGTTAFTSTIVNSVDLSGYRAAATGVVNVSALSANLISSGATITGPSKGILVATGGAGADTIITGAGGSNSSTGITGGAGADNINLTASAAKSDLLTIGATDSTTAIFDAVTGFKNLVTGGDKIDFSGAAGVLGDVAAGTATGVTNLTGSVSSGIMTFGGSAAGTATLANLISAATSTSFANSAANKVVAFVYGGDTYVIDSGATVATTDDMMVKLVGMTDATSVSTVASGATAIYVA